MKLVYEELNEFEFEVEDRELKDALVKLLCEHLKSKEKSNYSETGAYQMAMYVVYELDLEEQIAEYFEDELKQYFYNDASDYYRECLDYESEVADWFGTRNNIQYID